MKPKGALAVIVFIGSAALVQPACARQAPGSAEEHYRAGRYEQAIGAARNATEPAIRRILVRSLMETGQYAEAETAALNGATPETVPIDLANVAGEALYARGKRDAAEVAFARSAASRASDALTARLNHAVAKWQRGARDEALRDFDSFIDVYNNGNARTAEQLTAVATAVSYLGIHDPQLFHDAKDAFEEAAKVDPGYVEAKVREGQLFLDKYSSTEASGLFREALAVNPNHAGAMLGLARARAFDGTGDAMALADSSLAINPNSPEARAFRARLLLMLESYDSATAEVEMALAQNPSSLEAITTLGAIRFVRGDRNGYEDARRRALALHPTYGAFDVGVGDMAQQHRRYKDGVELARRGLALDSTNWLAHALVGLTELRLGNVAAARTSLETSFKGDPYNIWVKNTLDLLDTYTRYATHTTQNFELFLRNDEADVLALYMADLSEEAYAKLSQRYGTRPKTPVRVEVYPSHADFSVRSVGLAGLGALGVAFGNILALDSPAAREIGEFNWGSTLWHEIAHAVTLEATEHRIPRWLTEGLSVLDERRARPGWGEDVTVDFILALKQDRLLPFSELNAGFVRPTYPQQIMHSYFQASLVAELIEQEQGEKGLRDMLAGYRAGRTGEQVFRAVMKMDAKAFDTKFDEYMRKRYATHLQSVDAASGGEPNERPRMRGAFVNALAASAKALEEERLVEARNAAQSARDMFPEYAGADGPYRLLFAIATKAGDKRAAAEALKAHIARDETDYEAHIQLAGLLEEAGDRGGAVDVLERAMYISPYDPAVHLRMAELYAALNRHDKAVRERRAILALAPVDRADALYRLAVALNAAGDRTEARRQVLRALEIAPNFAEAQTLLLELRGS